MTKIILCRGRKELEIEADDAKVYPQKAFRSPRVNVDDYHVSLEGESVILDVGFSLFDLEDAKISLIYGDKHKSLKTYLKIALFQKERGDYQISFFFHKLFLFICEKYNLKIEVSRSGRLKVEHHHFLIVSSPPVISVNGSEKYESIINLKMKKLFGKEATPSVAETEELILIINKCLLQCMKRREMEVGSDALPISKYFSFILTRIVSAFKK